MESLNGSDAGGCFLADFQNQNGDQAKCGNSSLNSAEMADCVANLHGHREERIGHLKRCVGLDISEPGSVENSEDMVGECECVDGQCNRHVQPIRNGKRHDCMSDYDVGHDIEDEPTTENDFGQGVMTVRHVLTKENTLGNDTGHELTEENAVGQFVNALGHNVTKVNAIGLTRDFKLTKENNNGQDAVSVRHDLIIKTTVGHNITNVSAKENDIGRDVNKESQVGRRITGVGHVKQPVISSHHTAWSSYVTAIRPKTLNLSLVPVALGFALAYKSTSDFSLVNFIVTCLTAVSVHAAGNVVNTYYDYEKGVDSKKSDDRTLVDKILTPDSIVHMGALLYMLGCLGFIALVLISPAKMEHLALAYFGGLSSSFLYTGGIGFKYIALGDLLFLITFGPVVVLFSYVVQTGQLHPVAFYYAMPLAIISEAALHCNNARDVSTDQKAGIVTVAILIGPTLSYALFAVLLFTPYVVLAVMGFLCCPTLLLPLITIHRAFQLEKQFQLGHLKSLPAKTAKLSFYFGLFYVLACVAAPGRLPGM